MEALAVIFLLSSALCPAATVAAKHCTVPALYVFGDSLADVGNNNNLRGSTAVANFRPYGVDYPGGTPTGRFCNGYIFVDFLARKLCFKRSPPPALSLSAGSQELLGVNYASGGAGILDPPELDPGSIHMNSQLQRFVETASRLTTTKGKPAADVALSRSLFIISIGTNDLSDYSETEATNTFVSNLVSHFKNQLKTLYGLGARKYLVLGVPPVGCTPSSRGTPAATDVCSNHDLINVLAEMYNGAVQGMLRNLTELPGFKYSFINTYELVMVVGHNPKRYGFTDVKSACCKTNDFGLCLPNATICSLRRRHLFWDAAHPSQAMHKLIADYSFLGPTEFASPVNIAQLLHLH